MVHYHFYEILVDAEKKKKIFSARGKERKKNNFHVSYLIFLLLGCPWSMMCPSPVAEILEFVSNHAPTTRKPILRTVISL